MTDQLSFRAMGCEMLALLDSPHAAAEERLAQVPAWFEAWEQALSRFRDTSELSRLNQRPGQWITVSAELWAVLDAALAAAETTDGLVTPTLLRELEAVGYNQTFAAVLERGAAQPSALAQGGAHPPARAWRGIKRDARTHAVRLPADLRLDFGGIAKGWAADRAAELLAPYGAALVDAGGDIAVSGPLAGALPWSIGIADPNSPEQDVEVLYVSRGGVATSGRDFRRWRQGDSWRHHILDPRTGLPAETDVLSATVVAPSARQAEVAAKVALIRGSGAGLQWIEARPELAALLITDDGALVRSRRLRGYLRG